MPERPVLEAEDDVLCVDGGSAEVLNFSRVSFASFAEAFASDLVLFLGAAGAGTGATMQRSHRSDLPPSGIGRVHSAQRCFLRSATTLSAPHWFWPAPESFSAHAFSVTGFVRAASLRRGRSFGGSTSLKDIRASSVCAEMAFSLKVTGCVGVVDAASAARDILVFGKTIVDCGARHSAACVTGTSTGSAQSRVLGKPGPNSDTCSTNTNVNLSLKVTGCVGVVDAASAARDIHYASRHRDISRTLCLYGCRSECATSQTTVPVWLLQHQMLIAQLAHLIKLFVQVLLKRRDVLGDWMRLQVPQAAATVRTAHAIRGCL